MTEAPIVDPRKTLTELICEIEPGEQRIFREPAFPVGSIRATISRLKCDPPRRFITRAWPDGLRVMRIS